jgi:chromate transporter
VGTSVGQVFGVALRLGVTSFGGPIAHLGYFRQEYVVRRRWLSEEAYAEVVAVSQVLPGPASSQVGFAVGMTQRGPVGGLAAWLGFTLPSALVMAGFAVLAATGRFDDALWLAALKLVAVPVVLHAVVGMGRRLAATGRTATLAVLTFVAILLVPSPATQVVALAVAAVLGVALLRDVAPVGPAELPLRLGRRWGAVALIGFAAMLVMLPLLAATGPLAEVAAVHYRAGALVFGGGHVVLPLLQEQVVPGTVDDTTFLAGYGVAQAVPGPLFTFGTYLGQVMAGVPGAVVATVFIFLPGFLLLLGVLPFWSAVRTDRRVSSALVGVNAAVVGVLAAALYDPIMTTTLVGPVEVVLAAALYLALALGKAPPWLVVLGAVLASPLLALG